MQRPHLPDKFTALREKQMERAAAYMMIAVLVGIPLFLILNAQWGETFRSVLVAVVVVTTLIVGIIAAR